MWFWCEQVLWQYGTLIHESLQCLIYDAFFSLAKQEGASEEDISQLSKYKFCKIGDSEKLDELSSSFGGIMRECGSDPAVERVLPAEDAVSFLIYA